MKDCYVCVCYHSVTATKKCITIAGLKSKKLEFIIDISLYIDVLRSDKYSNYVIHLWRNVKF